jgi:hypothetical protein
MKRLFFVLLCLCGAGTLSSPAHAATPGKEGFALLKRCIMENDANFCRRILTPNSYEMFDRFASYRLMPCLPTDFDYETEATKDAQTIVKADMPAGNNLHYVLRMIFSNTPQGPRLNIPASLYMGLGPKWETKIQLSEQIYLMMRQNMGDNLTCDMLNGLISK